MTVPVRYRCPRCGTVATLEREACLADKSVTAYPVAGWTYGTSAADIETSDGVRFVCGKDTDGPGCGDPFYLNFVRFEDGKEVEPEPAPRTVTLGLGSRDPWRAGHR